SLRFLLGDAAEVELPMHGVAPAGRRGPGEEWRQRQPIGVVIGRDATDFGKGRKQVDGLGEGVDSRAMRLWPPGIADDERNMLAFVEEATLAQLPMIAEHFGMVGGEDDQRIVPDAGRAQVIENTAELG